MKLPGAIVGSCRSESLADGVTVFVEPAGPRVPPVPAFPGQDMGTLKRGLDPYAADPEAIFRTRPEVEMRLYTVRDSTFLVGSEIDGVIVLPDGCAAEEPSCFSEFERHRWRGSLADIPIADHVFDDVFVAFDAAWKNYYHWLCYGLAKAAMALPLLPPGCRIALPDDASRRADTPIAFSNAVYRQSVSMFGARAAGSALAWEKDWVVRLPSGRYRARRIHYLWTNPRLPTDILYLGAFHNIFADLRARLPMGGATPKRMLLLRDKARDPRVDPGDGAMISACAQSQGFLPVRFEDMDFHQQAEAIHNAEAIIAPHGAGLANLLFARDNLRILELNRALDGKSWIHACFYQIAERRGQRYVYLDGSGSGFSRAHVETAIAAMLE